MIRKILSASLLAALFLATPALAYHRVCTVDDTSTLLSGDPSYVYRGLHMFTLRWGRVHALEEFYDSQAAAR